MKRAETTPQVNELTRRLETYIDVYGELSTGGDPWP